MSRFVEGEDRRQQALLPSCLEDYVSEDNPARIGHDANRQTLVVVTAEFVGHRAWWLKP
jgi:hypothetical protein